MLLKRKNQELQETHITNHIVHLKQIQYYVSGSSTTTKNTLSHRQFAKLKNNNYRKIFEYTQLHRVLQQTAHVFLKEQSMELGAGASG